MFIIGKTHEAPQQVFRLLFYSLPYFIGAVGFLLSTVLASRKKNLSNARARKNKFTAHMLADARKDHSIPFKTLGELIHRKIPKISSGAPIFQRLFWRRLHSEGLIYGGKFAL